MLKSILNIIFFIAILQSSMGQTKPTVWSADNGNGTYTNPILHADYSDPDVIRVGEDFYMIASSFNAIPGLPILQSKDLVNWKIIGHAMNRQLPLKNFDKVQHGNGVWAPSIRYRKHQFYIYYPDPDQGIFLTKANSITGPWSDPILVQGGKGLIDPCPLWDDDGKVYLVHAYAGSRAGFKSILVIKQMNTDADKIIGDAVMVYDGHEKDITIEGPKIYKRNNFYYIFAPAGGVGTGWQLVLRSKNIYGPYERKVVLGQGTTNINGPHQGAWVNTESGEDWFIHFQDKDAYGRIAHLEPMIWKNDWPVIGRDADGDGNGEPVITFKKPTIKNKIAGFVMQESDEFNENKIGLQWQWQANSQDGWAFPTSEGVLKMYCIKNIDSIKNYWMLPNFMSQKLPAEEFTTTVKLNFKPKFINDKVGLMLFGSDYAFLSVVKKDSGNFISYNNCINADKGKQENEKLLKTTTATNIYLRIIVQKNAVASFAYSEDGISFTNLPDTFIAKPGRWVGAKVGLFCTSVTTTNDAGFATIDWFRFTKN